MKRFLSVLIAIIFLIGCSKKQTAGVFSQQKMEDILYDLHLADGYISSYPIDSIEQKNVNFYNGVYSRYDTDSAEVRKNLDYYASHPQELEDIYARISKRFQQAEQTIREHDMGRSRMQFRQDSIAQQRLADKARLESRDSSLRFIGSRDLFVQSDSVKSIAHEGAVMRHFSDVQRKWEMQFYYFPLRSLPKEQDRPLQPRSVEEKQIVPAD